MSSAEELSGVLPREAGYARLLGVPMDVVDLLQDLRRSALDGGMSWQAWATRHAEILARHPMDVDQPELRRLHARVTAAAARAVDDFDRWVFLSELQQGLRALRAPDPARAARRPDAAEPYEPGTRMIKALRVGTLEETNRWLRSAVAENPAASVQDLLTRAAIEVAEAKLELDRYDALEPRPDERSLR